MKKGRRRNRIEAIKAVEFIEALARCCPSFDTDDVPVMICCPFPGHNEKTPSFYLQRHRWHCFGACGKGGDVLDFLQALYGWDIHKALDHAEESLGIVKDTGADVELRHLQAEAERVEKAESPEAWTAAVDTIEDAYLEFVKPYLRCADDVVAAIALGRSELVFAELDGIKGRPPRTSRGKRDKLREFARWSTSWARAIETDVARMTGKDRMDCALQPLYQDGSVGEGC